MPRRFMPVSSVFVRPAEGDAGDDGADEDDPLVVEVAAVALEAVAAFCSSIAHV